MKSIEDTLSTIRTLIDALPVPVMGRPSLVAMKLQASSYKDASDIVGLMAMMSDDEKGEAFALAHRTGRDRKLRRLLSPPAEEEIDGDGELL